MSCFLCKNRHHKILTRKARFSLPVKYVVCTSCGLAYRHPLLTGQDIHGIYSSGSYTGEYARWNKNNAKNYPLLLDQFKVPDRVRFDFVSRHMEERKPGKVLEIGCGFGSLLKLFKDAGWDAYGIEPDPEESKFAAETLGLRVTTGLLETTPLPKDLDLIVMSHVFEHLVNPIAALDILSPALKPTGLLFIALPNILNLYTQSVHWFDVLDPTHNFNFSRKTLAHLLGLRGFYITQSREGHELKILARLDFTKVPRPQKENFAWVIARVYLYRFLHPLRAFTRRTMLKTLSLLMGQQGLTRFQSAYQRIKLARGLYG